MESTSSGSRARKDPEQRLSEFREQLRDRMRASQLGNGAVEAPAQEKGREKKKRGGEEEGEGVEEREEDQEEEEEEEEKRPATPPQEPSGVSRPLSSSSSSKYSPEAVPFSVYDLAENGDASRGQQQQKHSLPETSLPALNSPATKAEQQSRSPPPQGTGSPDSAFRVEDLVSQDTSLNNSHSHSHFHDVPALPLSSVAEITSTAEGAYLNLALPHGHVLEQLQNVLDRAQSEYTRTFAAKPGAHLKLSPNKGGKGPGLAAARKAGQTTFAMRMPQLPPDPIAARRKAHQQKEQQQQQQQHQQQHQRRRQPKSSASGRRSVSPTKGPQRRPKAAYRLPEGTLVIESDGTPVLYDHNHPVQATVTELTFPAGMELKDKQQRLLEQFEKDLSILSFWTGLEDAVPANGEPRTSPQHRRPPSPTRISSGPTRNAAVPFRARPSPQRQRSSASANSSSSSSNAHTTSRSPHRRKVPLHQVPVHLDASVEESLNKEWESPAYLSYLLESFSNRPILSPGRSARVTTPTKERFSGLREYAGLYKKDPQRAHDVVVRSGSRSQGGGGSRHEQVPRAQASPQVSAGAAAGGSPLSRERSGSVAAWGALSMGSDSPEARASSPAAFVQKNQRARCRSASPASVRSADAESESASTDSPATGPPPEELNALESTPLPKAEPRASDLLRRRQEELQREKAQKEQQQQQKDSGKGRQAQQQSADVPFDPSMPAARAERREVPRDQGPLPPAPAAPTKAETAKQQGGATRVVEAAAAAEEEEEEDAKERRPGAEEENAAAEETAAEQQPQPQEEEKEEEKEEEMPKGNGEQDRGSGVAGADRNKAEGAEGVSDGRTRSQSLLRKDRVREQLLEKARNRVSTSSAPKDAPAQDVQEKEAVQADAEKTATSPTSQAEDSAGAESGGDGGSSNDSASDRRRELREKVHMRMQEKRKWQERGTAATGSENAEPTSGPPATGTQAPPSSTGHQAAPSQPASASAQQQQQQQQQQQAPPPPPPPQPQPQQQQPQQAQQQQQADSSGSRAVPSSQADLDAVESALKRKEECKKILRDGARFAKIRRVFGPKKVFFCANPIVNGFFVKEIKRGKPERTLKKVDIQEVTGILLGEESTAWARKKPSAGPGVCLSIVTTKKNLDFHAESQLARDRFADALRYILENR